MLLHNAIKNSINNNRDGVCRESWNYRYMLVVPDDGEPLFYYDKGINNYIKHHGGPRQWLPTEDELLANDWGTCNVEDIKSAKE